MTNGTGFTHIIPPAPPRQLEDPPSILPPHPPSLFPPTPWLFLRGSRKGGRPGLARGRRHKKVEEEGPPSGTWAQTHIWGAFDISKSKGLFLTASKHVLQNKLKLTCLRLFATCGVISALQGYFLGATSKNSWEMEPLVLCFFSPPCLSSSLPYLCARKNTTLIRENIFSLTQEMLCGSFRNDNRISDNEIRNFPDFAVMEFPMKNSL